MFRFFCYTDCSYSLRSRAWQYRVLPFWLFLSPRVFTKVIDGALAPLRVNYLNDWLILARYREQLCNHRDLVLRHLSQLGFRVNREKSKLSHVQRITFLCVELDLVNMMACLMDERTQSVLNCLSSTRGRNVVPLKQFQRLLGHMASAAAVTPLRLLWDHFSTGYTPESRDGHGAAVHFRWTSHRSIAAPSAPGRTLLFYGPWSPLNKCPGKLLSPLMISGTHVERVSSFKYLSVNISEDLTWTTHIQTQVKKARQRLYHLRQLRKFRVSPAILKTFYSGAIESVLTQCISVWYNNATNQDCKALQRVVRLAERISGFALPSLQAIYIKRCKSRAAKILKDSTHPGNHLFCLLPSGRCFRSMMAKTERLRKSFFPQAIRLLNSNSVS